MGETASLTLRQSIPVTIGEYVLYCEQFKIIGVKNFSESPVVSGDGIITNICQRGTKITFSGRICDEDSPLKFISYADSMMRSESVFEILYRGIRFSGCRIQEFTAEDSGEDYILSSITLISSSSVAVEE